MTERRVIEICRCKGNRAAWGMDLGIFPSGCTALELGTLVELAREWFPDADILIRTEKPGYAGPSTGDQP